jgi:3-isopropylmalate/(R)-2-methylmalate dehydratase small subunit
MERFEVLTAVAVPFEESNVDTDQICPARLIRTLVGKGSERVFFHDRRFERDGSPKPDFIFNDPTYASARIIIANRNFGVGSSREAAVFALVSAGYRAVVAESFGDIFVANCFKNGVLPVRLAADVLAALRNSLRQQPGASVTIDLPAQTVTGPDGDAHAFEIGALRKRCLVEGLDDLTLTEGYLTEIESFEHAYYSDLPWLQAQLPPPAAGS